MTKPGLRLTPFLTGVKLFRPRAWIVVLGALLLGIACLLLLSSYGQPEVNISLKRYGRTAEGQPVAWLVVSNNSPAKLRLYGDSNPVPTAFCEYRQQLT